ncbi:MAG: MFS transporter [Chloroflexi bacterium]|nr:MFS transporter [Chloroflexota bacterium]
MPLRRDSVLPLLAAAVFLTAGVFGIRPLISYKALALGATPLEIGLIASSFAILGLFGAVPVGRLTDRFGGRLLTISGCLVVAVVLLLLVFADSLLALGAAQAGLGAGQLMMAIGSHTAVTSRATGRARDHRIGLYASAASLGVGLGPIAAAFIAGEDVAGPGGQVAFVFGALLALLAAGSAALLAPDRPERQPAHAAAGGPATFLDTLRLPGMRPAIVASIVVLASWDIIVAYMPVLGEERGVPPQSIGLAVGALALAGMGSRMVLSRLVAWFGYPPVLVGSMVIPAVILPAVLVVSGDFAMIVVMALAGLGLGLGQPISIVLVAVAAPRRSLGYAMSLRLVGNRLGQLTIPAVIGATAGSAGVAAIFLTVAGMLGFGALAVAVDRRAPWGRREAEPPAADSAVP